MNEILEFNFRTYTRRFVRRMNGLIPALLGEKPFENLDAVKSGQKQCGAFGPLYDNVFQNPTEAAFVSGRRTGGPRTLR